MDDIAKRLSDGFADFSLAIDQLVQAPAIPLGEAEPPDSPGVYLLLVDSSVVYVGEAKGSAGLRDRLLNKHLSGDDSHAIQRAFKEEFPDRLLRRDHIKKTVHAKWVAIPDQDCVAIVERLVIWLFHPPWNKK